ncbi:unnamed protein product [Amoebophrya sp. A25]|nr:unnamed protein product [Amoebophrya sp. A25]|eukprot:GSA25T00017881001.1
MLTMMKRNGAGLLGAGRWVRGALFCCASLAFLFAQEVVGVQLQAAGPATGQVTLKCYFGLQGDEKNVVPVTVDLSKIKKVTNKLQEHVVHYNDFEDTPGDAPPEDLLANHASSRSSSSTDPLPAGFLPRILGHETVGGDPRGPKVAEPEIHLSRDDTVGDLVKHVIKELKAPGNESDLDWEARYFDLQPEHIELVVNASKVALSEHEELGSALEKEHEAAAAEGRKELQCHLVPQSPLEGGRPYGKADLLAYLRKTPVFLKNCSNKVKCNKEIVLATVKKLGTALRFACPELQNETEVVLAAIEQSGGTALQYASLQMQNNRDIVLAAIAACSKGDRDSDINIVDSIGVDLLDDREVVLAAFKQWPDRAEPPMRSTRLQRFFVLDTSRLPKAQLRVEENMSNLRNDRDFVSAAIELNGEHLFYGSEDLRKDRSLVLQAVRKNGLALKWASPERRGDKDIVLAAVKEDGKALEFASEDLQDDPEVVVVAIENSSSGYSLDLGNDLEDVREWIGGRARADKRVVLTIFKRRWPRDDQTINGSSQLTRGRFSKPKTLEEMSNNKELQDDREFIFDMLKLDPTHIRYASEDLQRKNRDLVLRAVKMNGNALKYACDELRGDRGIVIAAVEADPEGFRFASEELQNDREIVGIAIEKKWQVFAFASEKMKKECAALAAEKAAHDDNALFYLQAGTDSPGRNCPMQRLLVADRDFFLELVKEKPEALWFADDSLKNDPELILKYCFTIGARRRRAAAAAAVGGKNDPVPEIV